MVKQMITFKDFYNADVTTNIEQVSEGTYKIYAKIKDEVIGYVTLNTKVDDDHLWIMSVYVIPDYRGKGIFKILLNNVDSFRKKYYDKSIMIKVYPFSDEPKSEQELINMYKKYGFKETGRKSYLIKE